MKAVEIQAPECWKDLVDERFANYDGPVYEIPKGRRRDGLADPEIYVDDCRVVEKQLDDQIVQLELASGCHNYYARGVIRNTSRGLVYATEPLFDLSDQIPIGDQVTLMVQYVTGYMEGRQ